MTKRIITISREFGSGGRFIGEEVAKKLGVAYYDKDVIGQVAEQSGFAPEYIQENANYLQRKDCLPMLLLGVILQENQSKIWYMKRKEK